MSEAAVTPSAGALLRQAREAVGLHVASLAVALKVPVRKLEALEEDRLDLLPDAVFVRALASSVCRVLKIDPQPVLDRLPQSTVPRLIQDREGLNAPFRAPGDAPSPSWGDQLLKPPVLAAIVLLAAAAVLLIWPWSIPEQLARESPGFVVESSAAPMETQEAKSPKARPPEQSSALSSAMAPGSAAQVVFAVTSQSPSPASLPAVAASAPVGRAEIAAAGAGSAPAKSQSNPELVPVASSLVVFRAKAPSWIQVIDAKNAVTLKRLLAAGESASASGTPPLSVVVGRADSTEVLVRGKTLDLGAVTRDNIAKFEVK